MSGRRYRWRRYVLWRPADAAWIAIKATSHRSLRYIPPSVHFVGAPSIVPGQAPLPPWAHDLDGLHKIVLVTQGTVANHNFAY
jgi:hypothetical protein